MNLSPEDRGLTEIKGFELELSGKTVELPFKKALDLICKIQTLLKSQTINYFEHDYKAPVENGKLYVSEELEEDWGAFVSNRKFIRIEKLELEKLSGTRTGGDGLSKQSQANKEGE